MPIAWVKWLSPGTPQPGPQTHSQPPHAEPGSSHLQDACVHLLTPFSIDEKQLSIQYEWSIKTLFFYFQLFEISENRKERFFLFVCFVLARVSLPQSVASNSTL
jgi:hypothetical protein